MQSHCFSSTLSGVEARLVTVEAVVTGGLPGLTVVGLPDASVSESGARVRSALKSSNISLPPRRMVVNLSPADLRKSGSGFDLALALALLEALGEIPEACLSDSLVVGELSLGGDIRAVRGIVSSIALAADCSQIRRILFPASQWDLVPCWKGVEMIPLSSLEQALSYCRGEWEPERKPRATPSSTFSGPDLSSVQGQPLAKLALEISAAGGHHLAFVGPPGCGKSLLASCLPALLPPLTEEEEREVAVVSSVCQETTVSFGRPFRSPGVSTTPVALLGGYQPGEVTRAHRGVLFLDEFAEFRRDTLESLRIVMEEGRVKVSRARSQLTYPAHFTLVCAMNPCPCGHAADSSGVCVCSPGQLSRYRAKLSGPLVDRLDLLVALARLPLAEICPGSQETGESSESVAKRVMSARKLQTERGCLNRDLGGQALRRALAWSPDTESFCLALGENQKISMRAYEKWLRVARTVADLEKEAVVSKRHLLVARSLRVTGANVGDLSA